MRAKKKPRAWKASLAGVLCLGPCLAWLAFAEHGLVRLYEAAQERDKRLETIHELAAENQALIDEIHRLRTDMDYVEELARKQFNLVRSDEVIYRARSNSGRE